MTNIIQYDVDTVDSKCYSEIYKLNVKNNIGVEVLKLYCS